MRKAEYLERPHTNMGGTNSSEKDLGLESNLEATMLTVPPISTVNQH